MFRRLATTFALTVAVVAIAAPPLAAATSSPSPSTPTSNGPPFASGTLSGISGSTLSVQGANGSTAVAVTDTTTYQQTKSADASAIAVGDCARIIGTGSLTKGITAFTVSVSPATANGCGRGRGGAFGGARPNGGNGATGSGNFGGGNGTRPRSGNGQRPAGAPNVAMASGTVTSVTGDHLTAKATTFAPPVKKNAKPKTTTKNVKVTLSSATTITQTVAATADALAVGSCVTAAGTPNDTGTLTDERLVQPRFRVRRSRERADELSRGRRSLHENVRQPVGRPKPIAKTSTGSSKPSMGRNPSTFTVAPVLGWSCPTVRASARI
jgi:hypothetical protein